MKLRSTSALLEGWKGEAKITTEHSASSYHIPVLLIEGEPVGTVEAALAGYEILEASAEEREMLERAGYSLPDVDEE